MRGDQGRGLGGERREAHIESASSCVRPDVVLVGAMAVHGVQRCGDGRMQWHLVAAAGTAAAEAATRAEAAAAAGGGVCWKEAEE